MRHLRHQSDGSSGFSAGTICTVMMMPQHRAAGDVVPTVGSGLLDAAVRVIKEAEPPRVRPRSGPFVLPTQEQGQGQDNDQIHRDG